MELSGKVAVVTGGASGLGRATVEKYLEKGARVAIFDMNEEAGREIVKAAGEDRAGFWNVNVVDENSVREAINSVVETFGAIHVCNNFAGISIAHKTLSKNGPFPMDDYMKVINVNLVGTFNVARFAAEKMAENEPVNDDGSRGVIINTASVAGVEGQIGQLAYSASKGGVLGMTLPMARDLASYGIRVNALVPGFIHTPLFESLGEKVYKSLEAAVLYPQRLGRPEEIAHLCVFIVENDYVNGEAIRLDGGIRMQPR